MPKKLSFEDFEEEIEGPKEKKVEKVKVEKKVAPSKPAKVEKPKPAPVVASKPEKPAPAPKPEKPKEVKQPAARFEPLAAPPSSLPATKEGRLAELLRKYKADELTPEQYHIEKAKILAEP